MKAAAHERLWSDDELMALDHDGVRHELWFGKVSTMPPCGGEHSGTSLELSRVVANHVVRRRLGRVFEGQAGFRLRVDLCLSPDMAFVSRARLKFLLPDRRRLFRGAPDLVAEVLSPSDSITKTEEKLFHFLVHGSRLAWMVDPARRWIRVYREPGRFEMLRPGQHLTGNGVLPGFRHPVARLFAPPDSD